MRPAAAVLGAVLVSALATGPSVCQPKPAPPAQVMHFLDELPQGPPARTSFRVEGRAWDAHPDGQRLLVLSDAAEDNDASSSPERQRLHVVVNWIEELRRRFPAS